MRLYVVRIEMTSKEKIQLSKFMSLVLRHEPGAVGIVLDAAGWTPVEELLSGLNRSGRSVTREQLLEVVATNDKSRFALSEDGLRIRASQGHSVEAKLEYVPREPPAMLYHGTATRFVEAIRRDGLKKMGRQHVHLSLDEETAIRVGSRYGKPVV